MPAGCHAPGVTWPLQSLVLTTPRLVLRGLCEAEALHLAQVVPDDVELDPRLPLLGVAQQRQLRFLQGYWLQLGSWSPHDWTLPFGVFHDGVLIGLQALEGKDFAVRRTVDTHSWLVPSARGRGLGKQMRSAVLALGFEHLGATHAVTEAWPDNAASLGVSRALGYTDNGVELHVRDGAPCLRVRLLLTVTAWAPTTAVQVTGLRPCLPLLGLTQPGD